MAARLVEPFMTYHTSNGVSPLSGGKLNFYVAGTVDTFKDTFSDNTLLTANPNPIVLDSSGRIPNTVIDVWGDGDYDLVVANSSDVEITRFDNLSGSLFLEPVTTIAVLTALFKSSLTTGDQINVTGYSTQGDGGGDDFFWNSTSTVTEDLVVTFESDEGGAGRWTRILSDRITFAMGGAVGSGSDETTEMQRAMDYIETNGGLLTADGRKQYITSLSLLIENANDFIIDFNGAEIFTANGTAVTFNQGIIRANTCTDFAIRNLTGDGNRDNRTPDEVSSHAVALFGCSNARFDNLKMVNSVVDGFILATLDNTDVTKSCFDLVFTNCSADNSFRNGLSPINSFNIDYYHCSFNNSIGVDPEAGVDLEADLGSVTPANARHRFFGCEFIGNNGFGLKNTTKDENLEVYLHDSYFQSNLGGAVSNGAATYIYGGLCEDFSVISHSDNLFGGIIEFNSATSETRGIVDGMQFKNITAAGSSCIFGTTSTGPITVSKCTADNVLAFADLRSADAKVLTNYLVVL